MDDNQNTYTAEEVIDGESECQLMDYLPAIYWDPTLPGNDQETSRSETLTNAGRSHDVVESGPSIRLPFLHHFLSAFEQVLLRSQRQAREASQDMEAAAASLRGRDQPRRLEEEVDTLHLLFDPFQTPEEFLPWLAGWAALSLRPEMDPRRKRRLVGRIIPLYRIRGTKRYIEELLDLHLEARALVDDAELPHLQVGVHSTIAEDTYLGGGLPHFFRVKLAFPEKDWPGIELQCRIARSVIDLAKPAHTHYELELALPRMQVGVHCIVGFDTVLQM